MQLVEIFCSISHWTFKGKDDGEEWGRPWHIKNKVLNNEQVSSQGSVSILNMAEILRTIGGAPKWVLYATQSQFQRHWRFCTVNKAHNDGVSLLLSDYVRVWALPLQLWNKPSRQRLEKRHFTEITWNLRCAMLTNHSHAGNYFRGSGTGLLIPLGYMGMTVWLWAPSVLVPRELCNTNL